MTVGKWTEVLGWKETQIEDLRISGFSFLREGHYQKALLFFEALVILDPSSFYDRQTLGALYLEIGENEKALETLEQALDLDATHEPTLLNKTKALLALKRIREALLLARSLETSDDIAISGDASALIAAYTA